MSKNKEIFWILFQGTGVNKSIFDTLYNAAIAEIEKTDSIHARIKKFNQLIQPQLDELNDRELDLAMLFLLGCLQKYVSVEEIGEISDELGTFIQRDLGT